MHLVEIDVIGSEPLEARLHRVNDVDPRTTAVVGARPHCMFELRRQHHVLARDAERFQRTTDDLFRLTVRVDVGSVDEIDPGIDRSAQDRVDRVLIDPRLQPRNGRQPARRSSCRGTVRKRKGLCYPDGCSA